MERGPNMAQQILKHGLVGKPDEIAKKLKEYTNVGVDQFFLAFRDPFDHKALDLFIKAAVTTQRIRKFVSGKQLRVAYNLFPSNHPSLQSGKTSMQV